MSKEYLGAVPKCDLCEIAINDCFIDGKTKAGPWACMCRECHVENGVGLGVGRGQRYNLKEGKWIKTS